MSQVDFLPEGRKNLSEERVTELSSNTKFFSVWEGTHAA